MANEKDDVKKPPETKAPAPPPPKAPTAEEVNKALEDMVVKAEAAGMRDDPTVMAGRDVLDRQPKKEGKDAPSK